MITINKIGENTIHDTNFVIDRPYGHPVYLLILVKVPAKFYVDDEWITTPAHIAVIFRPLQKHLYSATTNMPYIDDWMHIKSSGPLLPAQFPFGKPILLHDPEPYYNLFHLIHNEMYGVSPHKNTIIDSLTNALLHKISDASNIKRFPPLYYKLVSLREQIYSSPEKNWNVNSMAKNLYISVGYFHSVYKHFFNTSCICDVIHARIQLACEFLIATDKSIEEIGYICGYNNTEHFIRQFKKEMNCTPAFYRRRDNNHI